MNDIQVFNNEQFGTIRTCGTPDEPLFCAADICRALGFTNGRKAIADHCDDPDVTKRYVGVVTGKRSDGEDAIQNVEMTFVNESGLYSLIFGSKLESAKKFKNWVTSDVLPTIRRHGMYATGETIEKILKDPDNAILILQAIQKERKERIAAQREVERLEAKEMENRPKVVYAEAVEGSTSACLIGELAKMIAQNGYMIGEKRLFQWLRDNHYLCAYGERFNQPYQQYIEQGLFTMKQNVFSVNGEMRTRNTTKVTGKGQIYFINKFLNTQVA
jgi:anti-repressor protein